MAEILGLVFSFFGGMVFLIAFILYRMMSNEGWDDSNITNAIRLLAHVTLHAEDFGKMYYTQVINADKMTITGFVRIATGTQPFWYVNKDELSEVVKTRP